MKKLFTLVLMLVLVVFMGCTRASSTKERIRSTAYSQNNEDTDLIGSMDDEYIPLNEDDLRTLYKATDSAYGQSKLAPGKGGVPYVDQFKKPSAELAALFSNVHFEIDDHILREKQDLFAISKIATYMKKHPNLFLVVEGHCDETASAAYNMSLGVRRANHIRVLLIKNGVDFNRIYPVSYGKERPIALGHSKDEWKQNRRAEFKIHVKE